MFTDHGLDGIPVDSQNVRFLRTPDEFYTTLVNKTKTAKQRIYLTSLYLGVGPLERQLVDELENTLDKNPKLEVKMLFDYLRGTRGGALGTAGMLAERKLRNAEVYLFHTPDLRGTLKRILPERMNEIVGLQHMKFFIFDDSIIISGANLSDTYFTNRQDRYVVIEDCPRLIEFFIAIYDCIASCSYKLVTNGDYKMNSTAQEELIKTDVRKFRREMNSKINAVIGDLSTDSQQNAETMIFPFLQMKPFGIDQEERVMERLLKNSMPMDFFGARGISGGIPSLYVYISLLFYRKVQELFKPITMYEWSRSGWSFHAKGIWIEPRDSTEWFATVIGSSNYEELNLQLFLFAPRPPVRHGESFVTENKKKQIHLNPKFYGNELVDSRLDDSVRLRTFNRIIGVISIDQEQELVRFGYLSFWGGRSNITAHLDSVVPLTDTYDLDTKMKIVKLDLGKHGSLLLSLRKCEIVDEELATEVFDLNVKRDVLTLYRRALRELQQAHRIDSNKCIATMRQKIEQSKTVLLKHIALVEGRINDLETYLRIKVDKPSTTASTSRQPAALTSSNRGATAGNNLLFDNDPVLKTMDKNIVETIKREIIVLDLSLTWDDVVGLESAKQVLREIIVLPFKRP
ncbi:CDP-diacylglycerol--glycerol-3-phosphate 3-phosphatidyltransferase [Aphelenchoides besseyi]|nr:CDP-diacylglycerol--glycerol-3-phosphate 3-phosphatidyltransferase [Aphelenchoides besseyi]